MNMATKIGARSTKVQLLAYIQLLEEQAINHAREQQRMRERVSVLEGTAALARPVPGAQPTLQHFGQRTVKRWMPRSA